MEIKRIGSEPSGKGRRITLLVQYALTPVRGAGSGRVVGAAVTFEPGARTAWHTHPLGQTLVVTSGSGRAQRWGGPIEEIHPAM